MRLRILLLLILTICLIGTASASFDSTWDTTKTSGGSSGSNQVKLPLVSGGTYNFQVWWGDGSDDTITVYNQAEVTHTYASSGVKNIVISGTITGFVFNNGGDKLKLLDISNWGDLNVGSGGSYFWGCSNFDSTATDALDLTGTIHLQNMFYDATSFNGDIGNWDTSNVVDMGAMFQGASSFNRDIGNWDVTSVSGGMDMCFMFDGAISFDQDLGNWNVSNLGMAYGMFGDPMSPNRLVTLSTENYGSLLTGWASLPSLKQNVMFGGGDSKYYASAVPARAVLTDTYFWTIDDGGEVPSFNSRWDTTKTSGGSSGSNQISLPISHYGVYDFTVYWGDGNSDIITSWDQPNTTHDYASSGTYDVVMCGKIEGFEFWDSGDKLKIIDISQWGSLKGNVDARVNFKGCSNLGVTATDALDLTDSISLYSMFRGATLLDGDFGNWDVSNIVSMEYMFDGVTLSTENYTSLLIGWASLPSLQSGVTFDAGNSMYSPAAESARNDILIGTYGWSITDNGRSHAYGYPSNFNSTWDTTRTSSGSSGSNQIRLPLVGSPGSDFPWGKAGVYDFTVWWGDGSHSHITSWNQAEVTHTYASSGVKNIVISGTINGFKFGDDFGNSGNTDRNKIIDISNWGDLNVGNTGYYFAWCENLECSATDPLDLTGTTSLLGMFLNARVFNGDISNWDTSGSTYISSMFKDAWTFNQPIGNWDVSNANYMWGMFSCAFDFNQDLGNWDVSSAEYLGDLFRNSDLSTANYNSVLISWASLPSLQHGVSLGAQDTHYTCVAGDARNDILIGTYGWSISDAGITGNVSSVTSNLCTESQTNPTELTTNITAPYFNWTYSDADNDAQYSWQIQVGTSSGASDMWNSGQLLGTDTSDIYAGSTLSTGITYYLRVRTSDDCQNSSWATGTFDIAATPTPVNIANTTGIDWINWTFELGSGIVDTDSFNISINGADWTNGSSNLHRNATSLSLHTPYTINVYAYNATYGLSTSPLTDTVTIPNNVPVLTDVSATYGLYENYTLNIDANYTDLDGDTITFSDNSSDWNIDSSTGVVSWVTDHGDIGIHNWRITINDGYGGVDYIDFTVTVHEASEDMIITSTDPSAEFDMEIDDSQMLRITLDRNATLIWYIDGEESRTDYNSASSSYYFTSSTTGIFNVTVTCNASVPVFTQLNHSWFITVTSTSEPPVTYASFPYKDAEIPYIEYPDEVEYPDKVIPEKEGILDNVDGVVIALAILFFIFLFLAIIRSGSDYEFSPHFRPPNR